MAVKKKSRRGGRRKGAGRPPVHGTPGQDVTLRLTPENIAYLDRRQKADGLDSRSQVANEIVDRSRRAWKG